MANNVKNNTHINNIYAKKGVNELPINLQKLDFYQAAQIMRSLQASIKNGAISYNFAPLLVLAFANLFLIGSDTAKASATHANVDSSNDILNVHGNSAHVDKQGMAVNEQGLKSDPTLAGDAHGTTSTSLAPIISAQGVTTLNYNNGKVAEATTVPHIDTYTPPSNSAGVSENTYLHIGIINHPVVAVDEYQRGDEDSVISGNVLLQDISLDGGLKAIAFSGRSTGDHGTVVLLANGDFTYTPDANFNGVDSFTYTIREADGSTATATVHLTVKAVNDNPVATNDSNTGVEDNILTGNLLANDTDVDGDHLSVSSFTIAGVTGNFNAGDSATIAGVGTLLIGLNGDYTFTPASNYNGSVPTITYTTTDGHGGSAAATLNLTVTPVNDAPVAVNDSNTGAEDTVITGNVLSNDTDVDGDHLAVSSFSVAGVAGSFNAGDSATIAGVGTLSMAVDGSYTFTPALNYNGAVPEITYTITDGNNGTSSATLNLTVIPVNDAPVANNNSNTGAEDTVITGNVLNNDTDVDGDSLAVSSFTIAGITGNFNAGDSATIAGVGTLSIAANGSYTFTPALNYNGSVPEVSYTAIDGHGGSATATLNLTVTPVNDAPVAANDSKTGAEDNVITGNVLSNDTDVDGDSLAVSSFTIVGVTGSFNAGDLATIDGVGTVLLAANGSYTFTPALNYNGSVPTITYSMTDSHGGNASATLNLTVTPVNDAPVATNDSKTGAEDNVITGNVLSNDTDVDGDSLTVSSFTVAGVSGSFNAGTSATITNVGTISIAQNGDYTFTPALNYNGSVPTITYTTVDGHGGDASATLNLTVTPVNDAPVATNDSKTGAEDNVITGNVLSNDTDVDGDSLTVSSFTVAGVSGSFNAGTSATITNVGTISIAQNGDYTFTPALNYNGSVPTITYTTVDGHGGDASATLNLTVTPVNDAPVATNDSNTGAEDNVITGNVLSNDTDVDGDSLTVSSFSVAGVSGSFNAGTSATIANVGTLSISENGDYTFTPVLNYNGSVPTITYSMTDSHGGNATATLTLTVTAVNDAPVATNDSKTGAEDNVITGNVLSNDTDVDGDSLTVSSFTVVGVSGSFNAGTSATITNVGTVSIAQNGDYTFTPASNYNGSVPAITYSITDGHGGNTSATLNLTVTPVNDAPVATNDSNTGAEDNVITGNVLSNDTDVDGDTLTVNSFTVAGVSGSFNAGTSATITNVGTVSIAQNGDYTFTPAPNYNGSVPTITYSMTDSHGGSATATLDLTVTPVTDAPTATNDSKTGAEDTVITGNVLSNDIVDGGSLTVSFFTVAGVNGNFNVDSPVTITNIGTVLIGSNGDYTFTPAANYNGSVPTITYTATDGHSGSTTATLTLTVTAVNDPPVANYDANTDIQGNTITGNVLSNDTDAENNTLSVTTFAIEGVLPRNFNAGTVATIAGVGTLVIDQNGAYVFTPVSTYSGFVPTVTYTVSDGYGGSANGNLTLTVTPFAAVSDSFSINQGSILNGNVATNDAISSNGGNVWALKNEASHGVVTINADGTFSYTPSADYSGNDSFTYTVTNNNGDVSTATVMVKVYASPVAIADTFSVSQGAVLSGSVATNDAVLLDGNVWALKSGASHGVVTINANGTFTYTPSSNYAGNDSFTYTLTDGQGQVTTATVLVTVNPPATVRTATGTDGADGTSYDSTTGVGNAGVAGGSAQSLNQPVYYNNFSGNFAQNGIVSAYANIVVGAGGAGGDGGDGRDGQGATAGTTGSPGTPAISAGTGGAGGTGGNGGNISWDESSNIFTYQGAQQSTDVRILSMNLIMTGGAGGAGGVSGVNGIEPSPLGSVNSVSAAGGNGGNVTLSANNNTFTGNDSTAILSMVLTATGGVGGAGGASKIGANGGPVTGGAGGNGGNAIVTASSNTLQGANGNDLLSMNLVATGGTGGVGANGSRGVDGGSNTGGGQGNPGGNGNAAGSGGSGGEADMTVSGNYYLGGAGDDTIALNLLATGGAGGTAGAGGNGGKGGAGAAIITPGGIGFTMQGEGGDGGNGGNGGNGGDASITIASNHFGDAAAVSGSDKDTFNIIATAVGGDAALGGTGGAKGAGGGLGAVIDPATGEVIYAGSSVDGTAGSNGQAGNATISFNNNILSPQSGDDTVNITLTATAGSNGSNTTVATINFNDNTFDGGDGNDNLHITLTANGDSSIYNFQNNSIDGGNGVNTLDFSGTGVGVSVDLTGNSTNAITLAGSGISSGNTITNIQNVIGTSANDTLVLGGSSDHTLTGGAGSDIFKYNALDIDDHITDFTTGSAGDVLNLKSLLQTFSGYDGTNAFSGGYVQFDNSSGHTVVKVDADGSAGAGGFATLLSLDNTILQITDTTNYVV